MKSYQQLFAELMRRRVFRAAAIYGATGFLLLQVADLLGQGLRLPDSFMPFVTAVILLGFPLALVLAWSFELAPDGVRRTEAATDAEIEALVSRPAARRWPAGLLGLAGLVVLLAGAWWAGARMAGGEPTAAAVRPDSMQLALSVPPEHDKRPSIAVLPFADMSPGGDQRYFSDGITEEILGALVKIRDLKVAARTSAFAFRDRDMDMRAIGDSLGVAFLIEGSVRKAGDQLRVTAQLIDVADGTHLWSEQYDRTMDDVFAVQTEIATAIADRLRVPLGIEDASDLVIPTADLEAYDLYLAGRANVRLRGAGLGEAIRLFRAAIARDSSWAPAWAALAEASELSIWYESSWERQPTSLSDMHAHAYGLMDAAVRAAERAIALDPGMASAYVALGSVARNRRDWVGAERAYLKALSLDPDNVEAHQQYSEMLAGMGRIAEARVAGNRALQLDRAPIRLMNQALTMLLDGRREEGIVLAGEGIALDPEVGLPQLRWLWQRMNLEAGRFEDAFAHPTGDWLTAAIKDSVIEAFRSRNPDLLPQLYVDFALFGGGGLFVEAGQHDKAIAPIEKTLREWPYGNFGMIWHPAFDPLRSDPAFQEILRELNLEGRVPQRTPR